MEPGLYPQCTGNILEVRPKFMVEMVAAGQLWLLRVDTEWESAEEARPGPGATVARWVMREADGFTLSLEEELVGIIDKRIRKRK